MKKLISIIFCIGIISVSASAQTIELAEGEPIVYVYEKAEAGTELVLFAVKAETDINNDDNLVAVSYATADEKGNAEFKFGMKEDNNGVYDIYVKENGKELAKYEKALSYTDVDMRESLMNQIHAEGIGAVIVDENKLVLESIGCNYSEVAENEKSEMTEILSGDFSGITEKEFAKLFNTALAIVKINNISDKNNYSEYIGFANPEFEGVLYNDIADSKLIAWITECIYENRTYSTFEEFTDAYDIANILYKIDCSRTDDMEKLLEEYSYVLGISESDEYEKYINLDSKHSANEKIVRTLKDSNPYTVSELLDIIENAAGIKSNTSGGGGGASSGGKSTGGASSSLYVVAVPEKDNTEEVESYFNDMTSGHWAYEAITKLYDKGIVSGDDNGNFRPEDTITREEFVKMLVVAAKFFDENAECSFVDVSPDAWYYRYIASGCNAEIVHGISEDMFGTGRNISRQDMMVLAGRSVKKLSKEKEYVPFEDENEISDYAKAEIVRLYEAGIANGMGDNTFVPLGTATRAQGAQIIYNIFVK